MDNPRNGNLELNGDLDELIDNECKNEERQSESDNTSEDERVSVGSKRKIITYKGLNENSSLIEKNHSSNST